MILKFLPKQILLYFCVIDMLLLPYSKTIHCLFSAPIVIVMIGMGISQIKRSLKLFSGILFFVLATLSVCNGFIIAEDLFKISVINLGILMLGFLHYLYFRISFSRKNINFGKVCKFYIIAVAGMAFVFCLSPTFYFELRSWWSMSGNVLKFSDLLHSRYTFIMSDPNSIGCVLTSFLLYLVYYKKFNSIKKFLVYYFLVAFVVVVSMSTTGVGMFLLSSVICLFHHLCMGTKVRKKFTLNDLLLGLISLSLFAGIIFVIFNNYYDIIDAALRRYENNISSGTLGGRFGIWRDVIINLDLFNVVLYGKGLPLSMSGDVMRTHNGHLHMLYSYGLVGYACFLLSYFNYSDINMKSFIILFPLIVLFSINTLVIDARAFFGFVFIWSCIEMERLNNGKRLRL